MRKRWLDFWFAFTHMVLDEDGIGYYKREIDPGDQRKPSIGWIIRWRQRR